MSSNLKIAIKPGSCPHGHPLGACPICNGTSGAASKPKTNPGEWTYAQCMAYANRMKAEKQRKEDAKMELIQAQNRILEIKTQIKDKLEKLNLILNSAFNKLPKSVKKFLVSIQQNIFKPALNFVKNFVNNFKTFFQQTASKLVDLSKFASEKLSSILGEIENFWQRKIVDKTKEKIKKFFKFFGFEETNFSNENENISDEEKLLNEINKIKNFIIKIFSNKGSKK